MIFDMCAHECIVCTHINQVRAFNFFSAHSIVPKEKSNALTMSAGIQKCLFSLMSSGSVTQCGGDCNQHSHNSRNRAIKIDRLHLLANTSSSVSHTLNSFAIIDRLVPTWLIFRTHRVIFCRKISRNKY